MKNISLPLPRIGIGIPRNGLLYFTLLSWLHYDQWNTLSLPLPRNGIGTK
jgi:hypothetical protein